LIYRPGFFIFLKIAIAYARNRIGLCPDGTIKLRFIFEEYLGCVRVRVGAGAPEYV